MLSTSSHPPSSDPSHETLKSQSENYEQYQLMNRFIVDYRFCQCFGLSQHQLRYVHCLVIHTLHLPMWISQTQIALNCKYCGSVMYSTVQTQKRTDASEQKFASSKTSICSKWASKLDTNTELFIKLGSSFLLPHNVNTQVYEPKTQLWLVVARDSGSQFWEIG